MADIVEPDSGQSRVAYETVETLADHVRVEGYAVAVGKHQVLIRVEWAERKAPPPVPRCVTSPCSLISPCRYFGSRIDAR